MAQQSIKIELGNGKKIVAAPNEDEYKELCVFLVDENDEFLQDLAIVGEDYKYSEEGDVIENTGLYRVLVYADGNSEDFTDLFFIKEYDGSTDEIVK